MISRHKLRALLVRYITRYSIHFSVITVLMYIGMIPLTIWVFPATTLLLTIFVLLTGFTAALASLADILVAQVKESAEEEID